MTELNKQVVNFCDFVSSKTWEEGDEICSICMIAMCDEEVVLALNCSHVFHHACMSQWCKHADTCPTCRFHLTETSVKPKPKVRPKVSQKAQPKAPSPSSALPRHLLSFSHPSTTSTVFPELNIEVFKRSSTKSLVQKWRVLAKVVGRFMWILKLIKGVKRRSKEHSKKHIENHIGNEGYTSASLFGTAFRTVKASATAYLSKVQPMQLMDSDLDETFSSYESRDNELYTERQAEGMAGTTMPQLSSSDIYGGVGRGGGGGARQRMHVEVACCTIT